MSNFFKNLGKGVLYVLLFPFILAGIAIAGVVGIVIFVYQLIKTIVLFFTGRTLFTPMEEDIKAQTILNADKEDQQTNQQQYNNDYQVYTTGNFTNTAPSEEDDEEEEDEDDD